MAGSERTRRLAPGGGNIAERAHGVKYPGVVMGGAFSIGGDAVSKGRFWA